MKTNLIPSLINMLITKSVAKSYQRGRPLAGRPWGGTSNVPNAQRINRGRRRNPRRRFGNPEMPRGGIEVNRNEGGFKRLTQGLIYTTRSLDYFVDLNLAANAGGAGYLLGASASIDLTATLNSLSEFAIYKLMAVKYKLIGIRVSVDYSGILPAGTTLGKMIINAKTDLLEIADAKANQNTMKLNMAHPGVKNFNFNLNKGNMLEDNVDWIKSSDSYPGTLQLTLTTQSQNVNGSSGMIKLGCFKDLTSLVTKMDKLNSENIKMKEELSKLKQIMDN